MKTLRAILDWLRGALGMTKIVPLVSSSASDGNRSNVYLAGHGGLASYVAPANQGGIPMLDSVLVVLASPQMATVTVSTVGRDAVTGILAEAVPQSSASSFYFADVRKALAPSEIVLIESSVTGVEFNVTLGIGG